MKIAIDVSQIVYGTGVSVYVKELVKALLEIDTTNQYILFGGSLRRRNELTQFANQLKREVETAFYPISPTMGDIIWNKVHTLPIEHFVGPVDVVHTSDWTEPPTRKAIKVTTIHDLAPFKFPAETHPRIRAVHERKLEHAKHETRFYIVPSHAIKDELIEMGFKEDRIRVVYEAVSQSLMDVKPVEITSLRTRFGIHSEYLFAVGTSPRKNVDRLVTAFKEVSEKIPQLVVVGEGKSTDQVIYTGRVSDEVLRALYTGASALTYPSLYEGFGLPILEAFNIGVPVVTSNVGSMKEIAGSGAVLVDPLDVSSISQGILKALSSRDQLIKKGKARAKDFSWKSTAAETIQIYEESIT